ncbi:MAG: DUF1192 domain-containing protein [Xanthobacteraceae bacterium]|nr:DUF1192 domain-containing protein [Xanthobacteraceae bacterium]
MAGEDDDKPRNKIPHHIGQDLSQLSVGELAERLTALRAEIDRLEQAAKSKRALLDAAASVFKT